MGYEFARFAFRYDIIKIEYKVNLLVNDNQMKYIFFKATCLISLGV